MQNPQWMEKIQSLCREWEIPFAQQVPLRDYTTFQIGGPARVMVTPSSEEQLAAICRERDSLPLFFLGRGSNLLVSDAGYDGIVVVLGKEFARIRQEENLLVCEAGASLNRVCRTARDLGLSGLEFAFGIPGTVGGAVYMNAGAYGGEMKDVLLWAEHLDGKGNLCRVPAEELDLSYRHSRYSGSRDCIVRAAFRLTPGDSAEISARMEELMARRREKQPLEYPSAGSTFKRPEGAFAAALIEQCGLKGVSVGDAAVSEKHSGFLINRGNATCADMEALIARVQQVVAEQTGYRLETEVQRLG